MVDYSETMLSINKSMKEVNDFLLTGDKKAAVGMLLAVAASAEMLAAWIKNN
jgi:hypothetical protein